MNCPVDPPLPAEEIPVKRPPKLLDQLRARIRTLHYSIRTENAYADWAKRFILFHGKTHPAQLGIEAVEAFLTHLAVKREVSASTQNQAKAAILFLYKEVLNIRLPWTTEVTSVPVSTTMIYTHVLNKGGRGVLSPLDAL